MTAEVNAAIIGGIVGAVTGAAASLLVTNFRESRRISRLTSALSFKPQARAGTRVTARVANGGNYPIRKAVAYISIHHDLEDVLDPPKHFAAFIHRSYKRKLQEDRLCWSIAPHNPAEVDILAGEWQLLDITDFGATNDWLEIPSELGWSSSQTAADLQTSPQISSRIFLRAGKRYRGVIKIVSEDTKARLFEVALDASNREQPLTIVSGLSAG